MGDKTGRVYTCEMCGGVFEAVWSDSEAVAEAESKGLDVSQCGEVCDDCYQKTPWANSATIEMHDAHVIEFDAYIDRHIAAWAKAFRIYGLAHDLKSRRA